MRLNKFVALSTGMSRRAADTLVAQGKIIINDSIGQLGQHIDTTLDIVTLDGKILELPRESVTIMLHKPTGYVCSRDGQGSRTIYDILPPHYHTLKPVGRLDKDSSGLLLLTNDGTLAHKLTHPSFQKEKVYEVKLDHDLKEADLDAITKGVILDDGPSSLSLTPVSASNTDWIVTMHEGRNRQIRRTFEAIGYKVVKLHRTHFGLYRLNDLKPGKFKEV